MTGISFHMQWPLTQREQLVFHYGSISTPFLIVEIYL
jgi:hypothetical protein